MVDDLGYSDLGCYGAEIETPNLDRLAENGPRFHSGQYCEMPLSRRVVSSNWAILPSQLETSR